ncbi:MAG: hypothetical protein GY856_09630, partial [bacterium]|nr:hypothetical protein [bacterium]
MGRSSFSAPRASSIALRCGARGMLLVALLLAVLLLPGPRELRAQDYLVRNYLEDDGLASSTVNDIAQDHAGRMWFATRSGICVYDGTRWTTQTRSDGLPALDFFQIEVDDNGVVWALSRLSRSNVASYDGSKWSTLPEAGILPSVPERITSFGVTRRDGKPVVGIGTQQWGLFLWSDDRWRQLTEEDGLAGATVRAMAARRGKLYLATDGGLSIV